jgi:hypothetical protein
MAHYMFYIISILNFLNIIVNFMDLENLGTGKNANVVSIKIIRIWSQLYFNTRYVSKHVIIKTLHQ